MGAPIGSGGNAAFHNYEADYAHIADPNERRRLALADIDSAPFGWYHVRACVVAGVGFFTDAYDVRSPLYCSGDCD
jgi:PHS family inorganic phosphate transporter-like MFS transporter